MEVHKVLDTQQDLLEAAERLAYRGLQSSGGDPSAAETATLAWTRASSMVAGAIPQTARCPD